MAENLMETLQKIQQDEELTKAFIRDPQGTLKRQGLNPDELKIKKTIDNRDMRPERLSSRSLRTELTRETTIARELMAGKLDVLDQVPTAAATVCGSIGYVVCGSVGD